MSDGVVIAIVGAMQAVAVALIYVASRGVRKRADAIKYEITNDHEQPLREDLDDKHTIVVRLLNTLGATVRTAVRDIGGMREDIRQLRRDLSHTDERVDELDERTRPKGMHQ